MGVRHTPLHLVLSTHIAQLGRRTASRSILARDLSRLGDVLRAALARLPAGTELANYPIWAEWEAVVGPAIARHAKPRRLRRGVLVVDVDGPEWMHELHFMKRELCTRLNARLERAVIRDLYFVLATGT